MFAHSLAVPLLLALAPAGSPPAPTTPSSTDASVETPVDRALSALESLRSGWRAAKEKKDLAAERDAVLAITDAEAAALATAKAEIPSHDPRRDAVLNGLRTKLLRSWQKLATLQEATGRWDLAEVALAAAAVLAAETHGPEHWRTGDAGRDLNDLRQRRDLSDEQRVLLGKAEKDSAAKVKAQSESRDAEAVGYARLNLAIYREVLGPRHPDTASSLNDLATVTRDLGDLETARTLLEEALAIRREALGPRHPDTAVSLNNLAFILRKLGDPAAARLLHEEALSIRRKVLDPRHLSLALNLSNLAAVLLDLGDPAAARPLYEEALAIHQEILGPRHPRTVLNLNNLGFALRELNDPAAARPLFEEALSARREVLGPRHSETASSLSSLATVLRDSGNLTAARPLHEEALSIRREIADPSNLDIAHSLNELAVVLHELGDSPAARPLHEEALAIRRKALGPRHQDTATSLNNLATVVRVIDGPAAVRPLHEEALAIRREIFGLRHWDTVNSLNNVAFLLADLGDAAASRYSAEAARSALAMLESVAGAQATAVQRVMAAKLRRHLYLHLSLSPDTAGDALAWKGTVLVRRMALSGVADKPELAADAARLREVAAEQAALLLNPPAEDGPPRIDWRVRTDALAEQRGRLERALARASAGFAAAAADPEELPGRLSAALPARTVLVDIHAYVHFTPASLRTEGQPRLERRLIAFVHRPGKVAPVRVSLGSEADAARLVNRWRKLVTAGAPAAEVEAVGRTLRAAVWEPFVPALDGADTVLVSPDGPLCRLPLAALPGEATGSYLIEDVAIASVPAPRLLPLILSEDSAPPAAGGLVLAVGDVDYDADPNAEFAPASVPLSASPPDGSSEQAVASLSVPRAAFGTFTPLAGTGPEAAAILKLAGRSGRPTKRLSVAAATESAFRRAAPAASVLHLATHGYFAPASLRSRLAPRELGTDEYTGLMRNERDIAGYAPGILSGLALTGANNPPDPSASVGRYDGILTAEEVAALHLADCELAVLSACETGLGRTAGGEGLLGLQRAFTAAGADAVVAGMWAVPDGPTRVLMGRFYRNLWRERMGRLAALREAQLWTLHHPDEAGTATDRDLTFGEAADAAVPAAVSSERRSHPRDWAGWTLSGDWR